MKQQDGKCISFLLIIFVWWNQRGEGKWRPTFPGNLCRNIFMKLFPKHSGKLIILFSWSIHICSFFALPFLSQGFLCHRQTKVQHMIHHCIAFDDHKTTIEMKQYWRNMHYKTLSVSFKFKMFKSVIRKHHWHILLILDHLSLAFFSLFFGIFMFQISIVKAFFVGVSGFLESHKQFWSWKWYNMIICTFWPFQIVNKKPNIFLNLSLIRNHHI